MKVAVIGGAGFIGHHAARRFLRRKHEVLVIDDFSRPGGHEHIRRLRQEFRGRPKVLEMDISRHQERLVEEIRDCDWVVHLAAQASVNTSVSDPRRDFEVNVLGTVNILEACRAVDEPPKMVFASSRRVYGGMKHVPVVVRDGKYRYSDLVQGVSEREPLDFHSPYGCSKGAADQYVRDYCRIYGIPTVVLRQSCIYGSEQFGQEDHGWLAHIALSAFRGKQVTVYGDGMQARDLLYIDDLIDLYEMCFERIDAIAGGIFNVGGGSANVLSVRELLQILESELGRKVDVKYSDLRPGDQKVFFCDIGRISTALDWMPRVDPHEGVRRILDWARANEAEVLSVLGD